MDDTATHLATRWFPCEPLERRAAAIELRGY